LEARVIVNYRKTKFSVNITFLPDFRSLASCLIETGSKMYECVEFWFRWKEFVASVFCKIFGSMKRTRTLRYAVFGFISRQNEVTGL
jgi:hypothetical protein